MTATIGEIYDRRCHPKEKLLFRPLTLTGTRAATDSYWEIVGLAEALCGTMAVVIVSANEEVADVGPGSDGPSQRQRALASAYVSTVLCPRSRERREQSESSWN